MRARSEASAQLGDGYRFYVTHVHKWGSRYRHVSARVAAYNEHEMKSVSVSFNE